MSSNPYIGDVQMVGFSWAPRGWEPCDGRLLPINSDYDLLYTLIGTTYGGDGVSTFAVPDLRGRAPVHPGQGPGLGSYPLGARWGTESVTLTTAQMPAHTHRLAAATTPATSTSPVGAALAVLTHDAGYASGGSATTMSPAAVSVAGGSQPHENRQPSLGVNFIIAWSGIFPSQA